MTAGIRWLTGLSMAMNTLRARGRHSIPLFHGPTVQPQP
jgi:hypothetical protein